MSQGFHNWAIRALPPVLHLSMLRWCWGLPLWKPNKEKAFTNWRIWVSAYPSIGSIEQWRHSYSPIVFCQSHHLGKPWPHVETTSSTQQVIPTCFPPDFLLHLLIAIHASSNPCLSPLMHHSSGYFISFIQFNLHWSLNGPFSMCFVAIEGYSRQHRVHAP